MLSIASHRAGAPRRRRDAALRQPHQRLGDVRRGARRPQEPLRPALPARARALAASRATSSCSPAGSTPTGCAGCSTALVPVARGRPRLAVRPVRDDQRRPRGARPSSACRATGCTSSCSTSTSRRRSCTAPAAVVSGETSDGDRRARRASARPRRCRGTRPILDAAQATRDRPAVRLQGRRLRHLPGAGHATARSTCAATTRSRRPRSSAGLRADLPELPGQRRASPSTSTHECPPGRGGRRPRRPAPEPARGPQRHRPADGRRACTPPARCSRSGPGSRCWSARRGMFAAGADIAQLRERRREDALRGINSSVFDRDPARCRCRRSRSRRLRPRRRSRAGLRLRLPDRHARPRRSATPRPGSASWPPRGASWRLAELVGEPVAKEILLAGRILDADEAHDAAAAQRGASSPRTSRPRDSGGRTGSPSRRPLAVRLTKAVFHAPREAHPVIDDLAQAVLFETEDKEQPDDRVPRAQQGEAMTTQVSPVLPGTVGVYGGGRMGAGIAHAFLAAGVRGRRGRDRRGRGRRRPASGSPPACSAPRSAASSRAAPRRC